MIKNLLSLLKNKNLSEGAVKDPIDEKKRDISSFIKETEDLLNVTCPKLLSVACIFESYSPEHGQNMLMAQHELDIHEIPEDAKFYGGYYLDDSDTILLGRVYPNIDLKTHSRTFNDLTMAENIFSVSHELRHTWQKKYNADTYYKNNAVDFEVIDDIAEIDADAFALAYVFSDRTPFTFKDFPNQAEDICLQATVDNGARWKRAAEISEEYNFNSAAKLEELEANVDKDKIKKLITIMKLYGMI